MTDGSIAVSSSIYLNPQYKGYQYKPKYCQLTDFEDYFQNDVTEDSVPNVDQVLKLIQIAEAEVDSKEWGKYIQNDEYLDGRFEILSFQWQYAGFYSQVFYPQHVNIIRVLSCYYNGNQPSSNPNWVEVKEGPGNTTSFVVIRKSKLKAQVGSSLLFYSNTPYPGPLRLKLTYEYGMNIDTALLREYVGKKASMDSLELRAAAENVNINLEEGPWAALYKKYASRLKQLRDEVFPKKTRKVWVYPSVM